MIIYSLLLIYLVVRYVVNCHFYLKVSPSATEWTGQSMDDALAQIPPLSRQ